MLKSLSLIICEISLLRANSKKKIKKSLDFFKNIFDKYRATLFYLELSRASGQSIWSKQNN